MDGEKEEFEMATAELDIKTKLEELKERALQRKKNKSSQQPTDAYLKELNENAELLFDEQIKTME